jgi:hypothetical protein
VCVETKNKNVCFLLPRGLLCEIQPLIFFYSFQKIDLIRNNIKKHLEKHIIPSKKERRKEITIKLRNILGLW